MVKTPTKENVTVMETGSPLNFPLPVKRLAWDMDRSSTELAESIENACTNINIKIAKAFDKSSKSVEDFKKDEEKRMEKSRITIEGITKELKGMIDNVYKEERRKEEKKAQKKVLVFESQGSQTDDTLTQENSADEVEKEDLGVQTVPFQIEFNAAVNTPVEQALEHLGTSKSEFCTKNTHFDVNEQSRVSIRLGDLETYFNTIIAAEADVKKLKQELEQERSKNAQIANLMMKSMEKIEYRSSTTRANYLLSLNMRDSELETKTGLVENFRKEIAKSDEKLSQAMRQSKADKERYQKKISALMNEKNRLADLCEELQGMHQR